MTRFSITEKAVTVKETAKITIEESFRITTSFLDARSVYAQKKKQSMGIF